MVVVVVLAVGASDAYEASPKPANGSELFSADEGKSPAYRAPVGTTSRRLTVIAAAGLAAVPDGAEGEAAAAAGL